MSTVVVTGADQALGRAVARAFAAADRTVVVGVRDAEAGDALVVDAGVETAIRADPRDEFDTERLMEQASRAGAASGIDVVAPCAQVYHGPVGATPLDQTPYSAFDDTFRTNARGVFSAIVEALPHLREGARVLVPTGGAAQGDSAGYGAFGVSAAAMEAVVRGFSADRDDLAVAALQVGVDAVTEDPDGAAVGEFFTWAASLPPAELAGGRLTFGDLDAATADGQ